MRCHRIPTRDPIPLCRDAVRPYLWMLLANSGWEHIQAPRAARGAAPTSMHSPDTPYSSSGLANRPTDQRINYCESPYVVTRSRPYLWKALAPGSMHPPPATRNCHPPPESCHSLLHLCTGHRPICTFAPRSARSAAPTSLPLSVQPSLWASGPLVTHVPLPPCPLVP